MDSVHALKLVERKRHQYLRRYGTSPAADLVNSGNKLRVTASVLGLLLGLVFALTVSVFSIIYQRQIVSGFSSAPTVSGVTTSR